MNSLTTKEIQSEISQWMSVLYDKDVRVDDVKAHVVKLTEKITAKKMKGDVITKFDIDNLCKDVEDGFQRTRNTDT